MTRYSYRSFTNKPAPKPARAAVLRARNRVRYMIRMGTLPKLGCVVCGAVKLVEAHFADCRSPKIVVWLCRRHRNHLRRESQEAKRYE